MSHALFSNEQECELNEIKDTVGLSLQRNKIKEIRKQIEETKTTDNKTLVVILAFVYFLCQSHYCSGSGMTCRALYHCTDSLAVSYGTDPIRPLYKEMFRGYALLCL